MKLVEYIVSVRRTLNRRLTRRLSTQTERPFQQLRLLRAVALGRVSTQAEAAEYMLVDAPGICRLVDRLESDGLMKRCEGKDRRTGRLVVTEAARPEIAFLEACLDELDGEVRRLLSKSEHATLLQLMTKLQAGLDDPVEKGVRPRS